MFGRKGQIALYVVIALLIISATALYFVFKKPISSEDAQKIVSSQVQPIRDKVEGCMMIVTIKTLNTMGRQGGYVLPRTDRVSMPYSVMADSPAISFALLKENGVYTNYLPSLEEMKDDFVKFMMQNPEFLECIDNFENFQKVLKVEQGELSFDRENMDFGEKSGQIVIPFMFPVKLTRASAITTVDNYEVRVPIDLSKIQAAAAGLTNSIYLGQSTIKYIQDNSLLQEKELRKNPDSDILTIESYDYDSPFLGYGDSVGYKTQTLFKIGYINKALEKPYSFYFLTGEH